MFRRGGLPECRGCQRGRVSADGPEDRPAEPSRVEWVPGAGPESAEAPRLGLAELGLPGGTPQRGERAQVEWGQAVRDLALRELAVRSPGVDERAERSPDRRRADDWVREPAVPGVSAGRVLRRETIPEWGRAGQAKGAGSREWPGGPPVATAAHRGCWESNCGREPLGQ